MQTTVHPNKNAVRRRGFHSFYSKGEEIFNAVSHIVGGALGLVALVTLLVFTYPSAVQMVAVAVFSVSIIVLYTMSALYHFLPGGRAKGVFRVFDHCTIFLLIAGTYTPYCLVALGGTWLGIATLLVEWGCALGGIAMNAIAMNNRFVKVLSMLLYIVMGWLLALGFGVLTQFVSAACLWLLLAGGIAYTAGIGFFAFGRKVPYFHSVWHLFDLAGTALHFASILVMIL